MSSYHLVNVWSEPKPGRGGFVPMTESMLWLPDNYRIGHPAPAFIYLHRWGGYPHDRLALELGPQLADAGFVFLSVCLRRRGVEGQLNSMPEDDLQDIKLALDYLHSTGCRKIILLGEELGGHSGLRYMSQHRDSRVVGVAWARPVPEPAAWLSASVGADASARAFRTAAVAARQGAGLDTRIELDAEGHPGVTQTALAFLGWWSPTTAMTVARNVEDLAVPLLILSEASPALDLEARVHKGEVSTWSARLRDWAASLNAVVLQPVKPEIAHAHAAGQRLYGLLWRPAEGRESKTAIMLVPGLTSSPASPLFQQMAPVLAQSHLAVLAVELNRSGWSGHERSVLDNDMAAIDAWMAMLLEAGFETVILAGASIGSISVGRYQSLRQHPHVAAVAHLMPTAECPDWFRQAAGDGPYATAVALAQAAIAKGRGADELIDIDVRQPPPSLTAGRFRWTQRAASWLSWWGPDADSRNSVHIANAQVPLLLLSGTADSYNDKKRFAELRAAAVNAPSIDEIWYPNIDHGLAGVERQVAHDIREWLTRIGLL